MKLSRFPRIASPACRGFTLLELLVATAVLALLLVTMLQILGSTNDTVRHLNRQSDSASQARSALDRFAADFSTAMLTGGASAICVPGTSASPSAIGFVCRSRARAAESGNPDWQSNLRGAVVGYRMIEQNFAGKSYQSLVRGDGRLTFDKVDPTERAGSDLSSIFTSLAATLAPGDGGSGLQWTPLGSGIVRFHISYQLDDGTITQTPPSYSMISPQTDLPTTFLNGVDIAPCEAIAFSASHAPVSGTKAGRYVRALIVAVATIDRNTLQAASSALDDVALLGTPGVGSSPDTDTALALWESNLSKIDSLPIRQNIHFYQRTISVP